MYLAVRTDSNVTNLALIKEDEVVREYSWESGRELSDLLLIKLEEFIQNDWGEIKGLIVYKGPGSFTGLRIGVTVTNALAYSRKLPIVGTNGEDWIGEGSRKLASGEDETQVVPEYGAAPNITKPRK